MTAMLGGTRSRRGRLGRALRPWSAWVTRRRAIELGPYSDIDTLRTYHFLFSLRISLDHTWAHLGVNGRSTLQSWYRYVHVNGPDAC